MLSDKEIAYFCSVIGVAPRQLAGASEAVTSEFDLGPRGPWMLGMIEVGIDSPSGLADALRIGRSLATTELNRLSDAGLIEARRVADDGRRSRLALTARGREANDRLRHALAAFIGQRVGHYSHDELMLCARILRDLAGGAPQFTELPETP
ncbi:MAG: MarR family winged helix-turn-helix transcriptional regulator [Novosphingobium sp.]|nr:MarR family winged helix-turn-helix transcriptional regulator [Novosphingobium sp.]